jgi:hypothetical protein
VQTFLPQRFDLALDGQLALAELSEGRQSRGSVAGLIEFLHGNCIIKYIIHLMSAAQPVKDEDAKH